MRDVRVSILVSIVCAGIALFVLSLALGQQGDKSKIELRVTKVAGNVYLLDSAKSEAGGNIAACVGQDGIVIVDDQYAPMADKIRAALKSISDRPIRFVINTHYHDDHTGGNVIFQKDATILAQENVRKRLEAGGVAGNGASMHFNYVPVAKDALPIITFDRDISVHLNGEDIRAVHFPAGHTDGDSVIYFPQSNVVHMGDDFVTYGFPFIDVASGGSIDGLIDGVEKAIAQLPPDVKVIPGHGPVSTLDDVRAYVKMLKETRAAVQKAIRKKKTLEQMKQEKILDPWQKYPGEFISADAFVETLYNSLTGKASGKFLKHN